PGRRPNQRRDQSTSPPARDIAATLNPPNQTMEQATPPAAAGIDLSPAATDLGRVHLLPCGIRHNSAAAVSDYFKPRDTGPFARFPPLSVRLSTFCLFG
uniref:Uncharacterized protein n=1 Tax=Aegilops tauschii subsp. strangulata TaxID=200361 RepID=A0A453NGQ3_AEGTS